MTAGSGQNITAANKKTEWCRGVPVMPDVLEAIGDAISIQDRDFRVLYQNAAHKRFFGDRSGEFCYQAYERSDRVCDGCGLALAFKDGNPNTVVRSAPVEGGGTMYAEIVGSPLRDGSGTIVAGIEVARDITERRLLEQDLQRHLDIEAALNKTLQQTVEDVPLEEILQGTLDRILSFPWFAIEPKGGIFLSDPSGDLLLTVERGLSAEVRKDCARIAPGRCLCGRAAREQQIQFAAGIDERHEVHYGGMQPHGHYCIPILFNGATLGVIVLYLQQDELRNDREEQILRTIASVLAEVIQRKRMEQERDRLIEELRNLVEQTREQERRLAVSERFAGLGRMASGIAHEINNPLSSISGATEGLQNRIRDNRFDPAFFTRYLDIVREEITRCKSITTAMLSFLRQSAVETESADVNQLLESALDSTGIQSRLQGVEVRRFYGAELPPVVVSRGEIRQVFTIVIGNALDAMADSGTLTLESNIRSDSVQVRISDTGPGVPEADRDRIFEPFFTTKQTSGGSGLDLSIARKIVAIHGGTIEVGSTPDHGATFTIALPLTR